MASIESLSPLLLLEQFKESHPDLNTIEQITSLSENQFVQQYAGDFGNDTRKARHAYWEAWKIREQVTLLWGNIKDAVASLSMQDALFNNLPDTIPETFLQHQRSIPGYTQLFGNVNVLESDHCRSIFGPAAYFVDLLRFIERHIPESDQVPHRHTLKARQPHLFDMPLDCENTFNLVPYIDLVIEVLEGVLRGVSRTTSLGDRDPYEQVEATVFPPTLPFHRPLEEVRLYLAQLKLRLQDIYALFGVIDPEMVRELLPLRQPSEPIDPQALTAQLQEIHALLVQVEPQIAREGLGLSPREYDLVEDAIAPATLPAYYGVDVLRLEGKGSLADVDVFTDQMGLSRDELNTLLFLDLSPDEVQAGLSRLFFINNTGDQEGHLAIEQDVETQRFTAAAIKADADALATQLNKRTLPQSLSQKFQQQRQPITLDPETKVLVDRPDHQWRVWDSNANVTYILRRVGDTIIVLDEPYDRLVHLTPYKLDRIYRFLKLSRKLGWSYGELDWALRSLQGSHVAEKVLQFDGVNDFVAIANAQTLNPTAFTLEAWVMVATEGSHPIVAQGMANSTQPHWMFWITPSGQLSFFFAETNASQAYWNDAHPRGQKITQGPSMLGWNLAGERSLSTGVFTHVAVTVNEKRSGSTYHELKFYINGVLDSTWSLLRAIPLPTRTDSQILHIGKDLLDGFFAGSMAEVRLWNQIRTADAIADSRFRRFTGKESGLMGYWPLHESVGVEVPDLAAQPGVQPHPGVLGDRIHYATPIWVPSDLVLDPLPLALGSYALHFNGQDTFVAGEVVHLDQLKTFTLECRAQATGNQIHPLVTKGNADNKTTDFCLGVTADQKPFFKTATQTLTGDNPLSGDRPTHLAVVVTPQKASLYVNGTQVKELNNPLVGTVATQTDLYLGRDFENHYLQGTLQEVRIWGIARTQEEIRATQDFHLMGTEPNLLAYWRLDDPMPEVGMVRDRSFYKAHLSPGGDSSRYEPILQTAEPPILPNPVNQRASVLTFGPGVIPMRLQNSSLQAAGGFAVQPYNSQHRGLGYYEQFTLQFWVRPQTGDATTEQILFTQGDRDTGLTLYLLNKRLYAYLWSVGNNGQSALNEVIFETGDLPLDQWHHVTFTYDEARQAGIEYRFYLNGTRVNASNATSPFRLDQVGPAYLEGLPAGAFTRLRNVPEATNAYTFTGQITDLRLWDIALGRATGTTAPSDSLPVPHTRPTTTEHLIAYLPMTEGYGRSIHNHQGPAYAEQPLLTIPDQSPQEYSATLSVGPDPVDSKWQSISRLPIHAGHALVLNGIDQFLALPYASDLGLVNQSFTVELWVQPASLTREMPLLGSDRTLQLTLTPAGTIKLSGTEFIPGKTLENSTGNTSNTIGIGTVGITAIATAQNNLETTETNAITLQPSTWYHLAWRYTSTTQQHTLFINGELLADISAPGITEEIRLFLGRHRPGEGAATYFQGKFSDLRIWSGSQTDEAIAATWNQRLVGNETGLTAYWSWTGDHRLELRDRTLTAHPLRLELASDQDINAQWQDESQLPAPLHRQAQALHLNPLRESLPPYPALPDYIDLTLYPIGNSGTIELWTRFVPEDDQTLVDQVVLDASMNAATPFILRVQNQTLIIQVGDTSGGIATAQIPLAEASPLFYSQTHHLVMTWQFIATTATLDLQLYLDEQRAIATRSGTGVKPNFPTPYLGLNRTQDLTTAQPFKGHLSQVRVWDGVRSLHDLQRLSLADLEGTEAGLLVYLPMAEGRQPVLQDQVSKGFVRLKPLTIPHSAPTWAIVDQAITFNGQGDAILTSYTPGQRGTLELWAKFSPSREQVLIDASTASRDREKGKAFILGVKKEDGRCQLQFWLEDTREVDFFANLNLHGINEAEFNARWHQVVITWSYQDGRPVEAQLYLDGGEPISAKQKGSNPFSGRFPGFLPCRIGRNTNREYAEIQNRPLEGQVSQVRAWNRVLSTEEIKTLQDTPWQGNNPDLAFHLPLNEGTGTALTATTGGTATLDLQNPTPARGQVVANPDRWAVIDRAIILDHPESYIACPNYVPGSVGSIELWVQFRRDRNQYVLDASADDSRFLLEVVNQQLRFEANGSQVSIDLQGFPASFDQSWHHLAIAWELRETTQTVTLLLNGRQVRDTRAGVASFPTYRSLFVGISRRDANELIDYRTFQGQVGQLRIWNQMRTLEDLRRFRYTDLTGSELGLVQYLPMNEGSGARFNDPTRTTGATLMYGIFPEVQWETYATTLLQWTGNYGVLPTTTELGLNNSYTLEAWIYVTRVEGIQPILGTRGPIPRNPDEEWVWGIQAGHLWVNVGGTSLTATDVALAANTWYHVTCQYDAETKLLRLGVNGGWNAETLQNLAPYSGDRTLYLTQWQTWNDTDWATHSFQGQIIDLRIWRGSGQDADPLQHRDRRLRGDEPNLTAYWLLTGEQRHRIAAVGANPKWAYVSREQQGLDLYDPAAAAPLYTPRFAVTLDGYNDYLALNHATLRDRPHTVEFWFAEPTSSPIDTPDAWVHLAAVYEGGQLRKLFQNGERQEPIPANLAEKLRAYWMNTGERDRPFNAQGQPNVTAGWVTDLRLWYAALTDDAIQASYNRPLSGEEANLYAYWPLREGQGDRLEDVTENLTPATLVAGLENTAAKWQPELPPHRQTAITPQFNGWQDALEWDTVFNLKLNESFTLEAWVKLPDQPTHDLMPVLASLSATSDKDLILGVKGRSLYFSIQSDTILNAPEIVLDSKWHHLVWQYELTEIEEKASKSTTNSTTDDPVTTDPVTEFASNPFTFDLTDGNQTSTDPATAESTTDSTSKTQPTILLRSTLRLWVDGVQVAEMTEQPRFEGAGSAYIGRGKEFNPVTQTVTDRYFQGGLGEIRLWQTVRTSDEIREWGDRPLLDQASTQPNLTRYWAGEMGSRLALYLDGRDDHLDLGDVTALKLDQAFTVEAWVKLSEPPTHDLMPILGSLPASDQANGDTLILGIKGKSPYVSLQPNAFLHASSFTLDHQWHHLVWQYEPTGTDGKTGTLRILVDGQQVAEASDRPSFDGTGTAYIGRGQDMSPTSPTPIPRYFRGGLADVRIWQTVRTPEQIQELRDRPLLGDTRTLADLTAYWIFDDRTTTILPSIVTRGDNQYALVMDSSPTRQQPDWAKVTDHPIWLNPLPGKALSFDGERQHLATVTPLAIPDLPFTLELWVKVTDRSQERAIARWGNLGTNQGFAVSVKPDGKVTAQIWLQSNGTTVLRELTTDGTLTDNSFTHIALTVRLESPSLTPTAGANPPAVQVALGINGGTPKTERFENTSFPPNQVLPLILGQGGNPSAPTYFKGAMQEVRLWQSDRPTADIAASLYHPLIGDEPELLSYWPLTEVTEGDRLTPNRIPNRPPLRLGGLPGSRKPNPGNPTGFWDSRHRVLTLPPTQPSPIELPVPALKAATTLHRSQRTIEVWFLCENLTSSKKQILYAEGDDQRGLSIFIQSGILTVAGWNKPLQESGWQGSQIQSDRLQPNHWHHVALVLNGKDEVRDNAFRALLDGRVIDTQPGSQLWGQVQTLTVGGLTFTPNASTLSFRKATVADSLQGQIRTVRVWATARTDAELRDHRYQLPSSGTDALVFYWDTTTLTGNLVAPMRLPNPSETAISSPILPLVDLAHLRQLQADWEQPIEQLCALWVDLRHTGTGDGRTLFDSVFNPAGSNPYWAYGQRLPWAIASDEPSQRQTRTRLLSTLRVPAKDLMAMVQFISSADAEQITLDGRYLTMLYRLKLLATLLRLSIPEVVGLIGRLQAETRMGDRPLSDFANFTVQDVLQLKERAEWMSSAGITLAEYEFLAYNIQSQQIRLPYTDAMVADTAITVLNHSSEFLLSRFSLGLESLTISDAAAEKIYELLLNRGFLQTMALQIPTATGSFKLNEALAVITPEVLTLQEGDPTLATLKRDIMQAVAQAMNWKPDAEELPTLATGVITRLQDQRRAFEAALLNDFASLLDTDADRLFNAIANTTGKLYAQGTLDIAAMLQQFSTVALQQTLAPESDLSQDLQQLNKVLFLLSQFDLSELETRQLLAHSEDLFGIAPAGLFTPTLGDLQRLGLFEQLKQAWGDRDNQLIQVLQGDLPLHEFTDWPQADIVKVAEKLRIPSGTYHTLPALERLYQAFTLLETLGADPAYLFSLADTEHLAFADYQHHAETLRDLVRSHYTEDQWPQVERPIHDLLAVPRRDALTAVVPALLATQLQESLRKRKDLTNETIQAQTQKLQAQITPNLLYEYLLIDVQTGSAVETSRIVQGIASLQLYVQRCLMNLEYGVKPEQIPLNEWEWMKNYRVWEANRKVFLYPENYIEPELRDTKTPLFAELQESLLQGNITAEGVASAYTRYLDQFAALTNLTIVGSYFDTSIPPKKGNTTSQPKDEPIKDEQTILYLVGRNENTKEYYIRELINQRQWTPWKKIGITINAEYVSPVFAFNRLFLFWAEIQDSVRTEPRRWVANNANGKPIDQLGIEIKLKNKTNLNLQLEPAITSGNATIDAITGGTLDPNTFEFSNKDDEPEYINSEPRVWVANNANDKPIDQVGNEIKLKKKEDLTLRSAVKIEHATEDKTDGCQINEKTFVVSNKNQAIEYVNVPLKKPVLKLSFQKFGQEWTEPEQANVPFNQPEQKEQKELDEWERLQPNWLRVYAQRWRGSDVGPLYQPPRELLDKKLPVIQISSQSSNSIQVPSLDTPEITLSFWLWAERLQDEQLTSKDEPTISIYRLLTYKSDSANFLQVQLGQNKPQKIANRHAEMDAVERSKSAVAIVEAALNFVQNSWDKKPSAETIKTHKDNLEKALGLGQNKPGSIQESIELILLPDSGSPARNLAVTFIEFLKKVKEAVDSLKSTELNRNETATLAEKVKTVATEALKVAKATQVIDSNISVAFVQEKSDGATSEASTARTAADTTTGDPLPDVNQPTRNVIAAAIASLNSTNGLGKNLDAAASKQGTFPKWERGEPKLLIQFGTNSPVELLESFPRAAWIHITLRVNLKSSVDKLATAEKVSGEVWPLIYDNVAKHNLVTVKPFLVFQDVANPLKGSASFMVGASDNPDTEEYRARMSEACLWRRKLSNSEIRSGRYERKYGQEKGLHINLPLDTPSSSVKIDEIEDLQLYKTFAPEVLKSNRERVVLCYGDRTFTLRNTLKDPGFFYTLEKGNSATENYNLILREQKERQGVVRFQGALHMAVEQYAQSQSVLLFDRLLPESRDSILKGEIPTRKPLVITNAEAFWKGATTIDLDDATIAKQVILKNKILRNNDSVQLEISASYIMDVHNRPGWYILDIGDQTFLVKIKINDLRFLTAEERQRSKLNPTQPEDGSGQAFILFYERDQNLEMNSNVTPKFEFTRLNTFAVTQLHEKFLAEGISGLLEYESQIIEEPDFEKLAAKSDGIIAPKYSSGTIDNRLDFDGAYGIYYQEIFFHIPLLIANQLSADQRFAEAQEWYHYIFNPTVREKSDTTVAKTKDRYWRYRGFRNLSLETISELLSNKTALEAYRKDPFGPHAIAALRINTYQKTVVMKYINNLLNWGDSLFRQDTRESITEATQLYVLAYTLLGQRPRSKPAPIPEQMGSYNDIQAELKPTASLPLPDFLITSPVPTNGQAAPKAIPFDPNRTVTTRFAVPANDYFLGLWDHVDDRLFKIRNSLNIDGVFRSLALFEPAIDPAALVRAAAAGDLASGINGALSSNAQFTPHYRYSVILDRAKSFTDLVTDFGSALFDALKERDDAALAQLERNHEMAILKQTTDLKRWAIAEVESNIRELQLSLKEAEHRLSFYADKLTNNLGVLKMSQMEVSAISLKSTQGGLEATAALLKAIAAASASVVVKVTTGGAGAMGSPVATIETSGEGYSVPIGYAADGLEIGAKVVGIAADTLESLATYELRCKEWERDHASIQYEISQIHEQIKQKSLTLHTAQREFENHQLEMAQHQEISDFHRRKFANQDLYNWMANRLSNLYFQAYKLAYDLAKQAERAFQFEFASTDTFINFSYWDNRRRGLMAGEALKLDLARLEKTGLDSDSRYMEITKTISLRQINPVAFMQLRETGSCQFSLEELLFDRDFPGHYFRVIKSLSVTVPAVVGPYQSVNAMLTQTGHKTLLEPDIAGVEYLMGLGSDRPDSVRVNWRANQQIAISRAIEDSGVFELDFSDDRYLPFENTGVVSEWLLEIPKDTNFFDYDTITDVILHLSYLSIADSGSFRDEVRNLDAFKTYRSARLFNITQEFSAQWYAFTTTDSDTLELPIPANTFPSNINQPSLTDDSIANIYGIFTDGTVEMNARDTLFHAAILSKPGEPSDYRMQLTLNDLRKKPDLAALLVILNYESTFK